MQLKQQLFEIERHKLKKQCKKTRDAYQVWEGRIIRCILLVIFLVVLASFFMQIAAASCDYTGTYEFSQYQETKDSKGQVTRTDGPIFSLELKQDGDKITGKYNGVSLEGSVIGYSRFWRGPLGLV
jgi:hypothetical protein